MPRSRQPQNATIHSGRFSLQKTTLSPLRSPSACSRAAKPRAARATSAYVMAAAAEAVVVDEELAARVREIVEEVDERVAGHE